MQNTDGGNAKGTFRATLKEIMHLFLHQDPSAAILEGLTKMRVFIGADRVFVGYFEEKNSQLSFLHESCAEGVDNLIEQLERDFKECVFKENSKYQWWFENLKAGRDTVLDNVYEAPEAWKELVGDMIVNKVKSVLTFPIYGDKRITGFLGVEFLNDFHTWTETELENIHLFADLFAIGIEKRSIQLVAEASRKDVLRGNELFRKIFNTLPVGIEVYDKEGYLTNINPYGLKLLGTTNESVLGVNLYENPIISDSDKESIRQGKDTDVMNDYSYDVITQEGFFTTKYQHEVIRLNGKYIPLRDESDDIFGFLALVHHDESYYLQKEELRANFAKLQLAINSVECFLWEYDIENDKVTIDYDFLGVNKERWHNLLFDPAMTREEHFARVHEEDAGRMVAGISSLIRDETSFFTLKYRQRMGDDKFYWFSSNYSVYKRDRNGKPLNLICLTRDITEQHKQEMELFKAREALEVKNAFIENISHEIRTPLNIIVGFSNVLAENNDTPENQYMVELIQDNNRQLLELIDSILSLAQIAKGRIKYNLELVDVKELCQAAFRLKHSTKREGNELIFDESHPSCLVKVDKDRMIQVIFQLLNNADKYTNQGTVRLAYYQDSPSTVRIEVVDNGLGLTLEEIDNITLQFYKVNSFNKGLGLGLPLSRELVEDMGGYCDVTSVKGEGSNFWFTLPIAES